ncbi:MAG: MarR family transcriptional regulator [Candidatus Lokiarchaeota archaeon]|nr:MarR family transcriptional regulator [Candidatus Lokiarchaeota archaeon]
MNSNQAPDYDFRFRGKIKDYEKTLIKFFIDIGKNKDTPAKIQEILGYLIIHDKLSQSNLKELTGYSSGTISATLGNLVELGVVQKERIASSNMNLYSKIGDLPKIFETSSEVSIEQFTLISKFMENKLNELEEYKGKEGYKNLRTQLNVLLDGYKKVMKITPSMTKMLSDN